MIGLNNLLNEHRKNNFTKDAEIINFKGIKGKDVYNITAPFILNGKLVLAGRVEKRDSEESQVYLFHQIGEKKWERIPNSLTLDLQDPFVTIIDGFLILGGVEVDFSNLNEVKWRTTFFKLINESKCEKIFTGPWGMKDLRLKQLQNGEILILTRPQGSKGGLGRIGLTKVSNFEDINLKIIDGAPLLQSNFSEEIWMGTNEVYEINNEIWALGHIATFDIKMDRHYYSIFFKINIEKMILDNIRIIAERKDFCPSPAKRKDLEDVVFGGGMIFHSDFIELYAGISDASAQKIVINNIFSLEEKR